MFSLPLSALLIISILGTSAANILRGVYSKKFEMAGVALWKSVFYQNIASIIVVFLIYLTSNSNFRLSPFSVLLGIAMALSNIFSAEFTLKAQSTGSLTYTMVIIALSAVLPTFSGLILFDERVTVVQFIGTLFMAVGIILSPDNSQGTKSKASLKWLIYCIAAFTSTGMIGVIQKIHQSSSIHCNEMPSMLLTCFLISSAFSGVKLFRETKNAENCDSRNNAGAFQVIVSAAAGASVALPHTVNLFISGKLPSVILFPTVNLLPMILTILFSVIVLHERITKKRWIGVIVCILATVLVSGIIG